MKKYSASIILEEYALHNLRQVAMSSADAGGSVHCVESKGVEVG